jgi:hypothetical protein
MSLPIQESLSLGSSPLEPDYTDPTNVVLVADTIGLLGDALITTVFYSPKSQTSNMPEQAPLGVRCGIPHFTPQLSPLLVPS